MVNCRKSFTGWKTFIAELNDLDTKEDLIKYLTENIDKFSDSNVTAYETIRRLWTLAAGNGGLLMQEREKTRSCMSVIPMTGFSYLLPRVKNRCMYSGSSGMNY